jgi:hypothetical protein
VNGGKGTCRSHARARGRSGALPFLGRSPLRRLPLVLGRAAASDDRRSVDFVHGHPWLSTPAVRTIRHDTHGSTWTKSKERMVSAVDSDDRRSADFVHGHPWLSTPTIRIARHDTHGCPWTKSKERMTSAVACDDPNRATRKSGVPACFSMRNGWCQPSTPTRTVPQTSSAGTHGLPTPHNRDPRQREPPQPRPLKPRVPLDEVQGTDDASRRLRHERFRRLRLRALMACRLHTTVIHAKGSGRSRDRSNLLPACFSMRNGWCQPSTPTIETRHARQSATRRKRYGPLVAPQTCLPSASKPRSQVSRPGSMSTTSLVA